MKNREVAHIFKTIADILEIKDENFFRIRAYRRAAQSIENITEDVGMLVKEKKLHIPGIGVDLAAKIEEIVTTGQLQYYEKLKRTIPTGVLEIMTIPGVGPKTAKLLYEKMSIDSVAKLQRAAQRHTISTLFGIKEKTEENILRGIELIRHGQERILLPTALGIARQVIAGLKSSRTVQQIRVAGSLRRRQETIGDIDILVTSRTPVQVMDVFTGLGLVKEILAKGKTKSSVRTEEDVQVDLRVVKPDNFGAALVYFTGSKAHNIRIRDLAKRNGLKVNEYGVFDEKTKRLKACKTEKDVYRALKLSFIEPELREDNGEIEAAREHTLPRLITKADIKADFHVHSQWSDGTCTIAEMAEGARAQGYEYIIITDHSQSLRIARGLRPAQLRKQIAEIKKLNQKFKNFRILCGSEVDIKSDGSLDFDEETLKKLDVVLAAIHSGFKQTKAQLTKRIVAAMHNPYVNIIVHPFGRLIGERPAYELDFEQIVTTARETNTALEINCYAKRLDLDDVHARRVKDAGVMLALGTDSHDVEQLDKMELGVSVARRGWVEKKDVLNCLSCAGFLKRIKKG